MGNVSHWYAVAPAGMSRAVARVVQAALVAPAEPVVQEAAAARAAVADQEVARVEQNAPHRRNVKKCVKSVPE